MTTSFRSSRKPSDTPADTWVESYFHDDTKLKDKRPLNRRVLDQVSTEHPVAVNHRGGHTSFYNSKAFELARVTKDTPNPPGGTFDKDATGELNGRVTDRARSAMSGGRRPSFTPEQRAQRSRDGLAHMSKQFARYGLTSVHHQGGDLEAIRDIRSRGDLKHRVSYEVSGQRVPVVRTGNVNRALEKLKEHGFWIYGLDERGQQDFPRHPRGR